MTEQLDKAAEAYVKDRLTLYSFPESAEQYRLLMEISFMQGAQWQQRNQINFLEQQVGEIRQELRSMERDQPSEVITNAH